LFAQSGWAGLRMVWHHATGHFRQKGRLFQCSLVSAWELPSFVRGATRIWMFNLMEGKLIAQLFGNHFGAQQLANVALEWNGGFGFWN